MQALTTPTEIGVSHGFHLVDPPAIHDGFCEGCGEPSSDLKSRCRSTGIPGVTGDQYQSWECPGCRTQDDLDFWNIR